MAKHSPSINNNVGGFHGSAGGRLRGLWILLNKCNNIILPQTKKIYPDSMSNWAVKNMVKFSAPAPNLVPEKKATTCPREWMALIAH